ncbi:MAG TPA: sigma-54 dependent transcriptional regulator [Deltaproteobacteria bacterium]|nr:sigma-54 dependent transcriptional regulator [Deltaproteobacteria bacterium]HPR54071.1 sigma-54 dependent transcriptional regulator [Deltaproteobacteria bacterium]HXK46851.1 sigma-54 dependent transcriptional regulator [Deltaproteobacteria bacterium]
MGIAILDSDKETVNLLAELIAETGESPSPFTSKDKFLEVIDPKLHSIAIISDEFVDVLEGTKQVYDTIEIIGIGGANGSACMKAGAAHFLKKPFRAEEIVRVIEALNTPKNGRPQDNGTPFVVTDPSMGRIVEIIRKVAPTQAPVLIMGESGTGKEVIARTIHALSKRKAGPYVGINLAAIPETLLESELFGYEKGAFTGAYATRVGRFEQADGGTILLDEVTEIGFGLQAKLLRVLQERQIDRVGGKTPVKVDFRVISTTNRDIEEEIRTGRFRNDLFFRLNVIPIKVPPLRERREDILPLAAHFIRKIATREGMQEKSLSPEAKDALMKYPWPGNVREMENVIERAMILTEGDRISSEHIVADNPAGEDSGSLPPPGTTIHDMEKRLIYSTLQKVDGNRTKAATLLGISIRTLRNKLNEYTRGGQNSDDFPMDTDCPDPEDT